jgi:hypothetical protein
MAPVTQPSYSAAGPEARNLGVGKTTVTPLED